MEHSLVKTWDEPLTALNWIDEIFNFQLMHKLQWTLTLARGYDQNKYSFYSVATQAMSNDSMQHNLVTIWDDPLTALNWIDEIFNFQLMHKLQWTLTLARGYDQNKYSFYSVGTRAAANDSSTGVGMGFYPTMGCNPDAYTVYPPGIY